MRKIPTLFKRNPDDMKLVLDEITPGCEWVLEGEGAATRKYDGTCVRLTKDGIWWARREVKPGKTAPPDFVPVEHDSITGKTVGWVPMEESSFAPQLNAAVQNLRAHGVETVEGTYELCGPKVNGNPEGFDLDTIVYHGAAERLDAPRDYDGLRDWLLAHDFEGIVWHHPDGRMVKLKKRDFS